MFNSRHIYEMAKNLSRILLIYFSELQSTHKICPKSYEERRYNAGPGMVA